MLEALESARNSAEVLEARDFARVDYDTEKSAGRMARAKNAHDEIVTAVYGAYLRFDRAQGEMNAGDATVRLS